MPQTIFITGASDGIGLEAAKRMSQHGYRLYLHGRNPEKLEAVVEEIAPKGDMIKAFVADLSNPAEVRRLGDEINAMDGSLDVLVNNAGVLKAPAPQLENGLDIRFMVNTIAPYMLSKALLGALGSKGRIINLSSAAQSPVSLKALRGEEKGLEDMQAYSQSKLALTLWTQHLVYQKNPDWPMMMTLNPGSLIGTKMVKEGFGVEGKDISIGAEIITRCATDAAMAKAGGRYFDNDSASFGPLHPDAIDRKKCQDLVETLDSLIEKFG